MTMLFPQSFVDYKNLPKNKGKDVKKLHKEWLIVEARLNMLYECLYMAYGMCSAVDAGDSGGSRFSPDGVTYYTPDGDDGITLGYYHPDYNKPGQSYYIFV